MTLTDYQQFQKDSDTVEKILDRRDMRQMLEILSSISYEKAEHLRSNWQDEVSAKYWEKLGAKFQKFKDVV